METIQKTEELKIAREEEKKEDASRRREEETSGGENTNVGAEVGKSGTSVHTPADEEAYVGTCFLEICGIILA